MHNVKIQALKDKIKVMIFVRYYWPGYKSGGPVRSIINLGSMLLNELDISVVSSDRDFLDEGPYNIIDGDGCHDGFKHKVFYVRQGILLISKIRKILNNGNYDIIYLNSFFDKWFSITPLVMMKLKLIPSKPVIIAVRGEFDPGALSIKRIKKRIYLIISHFCGLYGGHIYWQASSDNEAQYIKNQIPYAKVYNAPVPVVPPMFSHKEYGNARKTHKKGNNIKVVYISRICPKKNLKYALEILSEVEANVTFEIYGPIDDRKYWHKCLSLINTMPARIKISYCGIINHEDIIKTFSKYDLFLFPTKGENFGHVIYESLQAGCPALISDKTPFGNLEKENAGWVEELGNKRAFSQRIEFISNITNQEWLNYSQNAELYAQKLSASNQIKIKNIELFRTIYKKHYT